MARWETRTGSKSERKTWCWFVFQYNCESHCSLELAIGPNTGTTSSHSTAADRVKKDGCMMAVSTKFPRTQIRCVHHWMPGRIIGLRWQCGVERYAGDVYFISAYAPVHDQRAQTPASEALRVEFWRKLDGVIRQETNRCRGNRCMDVQWRSRYSASLHRECRQPYSRSAQEMDSTWT